MTIYLVYPSSGLLNINYSFLYKTKLSKIAGEDEDGDFEAPVLFSYYLHGKNFKKHYKSIEKICKNDKEFTRTTDKIYTKKRKLGFEL